MRLRTGVSGFTGDERLSVEVLDAAVAGEGLMPAFQPIVQLDGGATLGFEGLARWPELGDGRLGPGEVFAHAHACGRTDELDQRCAHVALQAALGADLPARTLLTINYEPRTPYPGALTPELRTRAKDELSVAFELTERSLLTNPHALLSTVAAMRDDGFLIALDDVGAHPDSLALLDVLDPDIIKLDMGLVQRHPEPAQARAIAAVLAYHERTGTPILAEGIENDSHLEHAVALGATLGQGYKFGHPGSLDVTVPQPAHWRPPAPTRHIGAAAPFELVQHDAVSPRTGRKNILMALTAHIEAQAGCTADPPMMLTALQHDRYFTPDTRQRYQKLAETCPLVAIFGEHLPDGLTHGVRGVPVARHDPLRHEWTVLALGPQLAVALIAREHRATDHDEVPEADRPFDFVLTYDRTLVTDAAHNLLARML